MAFNSFLDSRAAGIQYVAEAAEAFNSFLDSRIKRSFSGLVPARNLSIPSWIQEERANDNIVRCWYCFLSIPSWIQVNNLKTGLYGVM